jgi:hypothetical protein
MTAQAEMLYHVGVPTINISQTAPWGRAIPQQTPHKYDPLPSTRHMQHSADAVTHRCSRGTHAYTQAQQGSRGLT